MKIKLAERFINGLVALFVAGLFVTIFGTIFTVFSKYKLTLIGISIMIIIGGLAYFIGWALEKIKEA